MRLGLVRRFAREFNDPYLFKSLYCSLVRSIIEYGSIVWMPLFAVDQSRIESIQKQFLLFSLRSLNWSDPFVLPPYRSRLRLLNMITLRDRQIINCCLFVHDVLNEKVSAPNVCSQFKRRVIPYSLRNSRELQEDACNTLYVLNEPINRCRRLYNDHLFLGNAFMSRTTYGNSLFTCYSRMASS